MRYTLFSCLLLSLIFFGTVSTVIADDPILIDFYYSEVCASCEQAEEEIVIPLIEKHQENITVLFKDVNENLTYRQEMINHRLSFPSIVIKNETKIELVLSHDSFELFQFEGARSVFFYEKESDQFKKVWISK